MTVWQRAHALALVALKSTDTAYHPRSRALFDQFKRAVVSIEANVVEGYALSTKLNFKRHLRIALGSAAEDSEEMLALLDGVLRTLFGLVRKVMAR